MKPERSDFRLERAYFRSERGGGQTDRQTDMRSIDWRRLWLRGDLAVFPCRVQGLEKIMAEGGPHGISPRVQEFENG